MTAISSGRTDVLYPLNFPGQSSPKLVVFGLCILEAC
jgi:hypothetical protein